MMPFQTMQLKQIKSLPLPPAGDTAGAPRGKETVFVKFTCPFKDRLIPMEAVGKRALVEGTLQVEDISEEQARHYKEAAGASPDEIAKIVGPQKTVRMTSRSARIAGLEPATD